ncbi:MAG TPA: diphosphomevalonate decarboxylase [Methanomassiliicoccales archaeon]|nr:diphosphomevalonate decarboxylase [Methanomassiliicoccales archaeon]
MKASAIAYPIQGLIKYHGLRDEELRLPYHDSISVCTAPIRTLTTIEFGHEKDSAAFDGKVAMSKEMERILRVVEPLRTMAREKSGFRMVSENSFPSNIGLGASASGFAALAVAASAALGLDLSLEGISRFARRGAGSASRAVTGGFSRWYAGKGDEDSYSHKLAGPEDLDLGIVCALVPVHKYTDTAHKDVVTSPFFKARLEYVVEALDKMEKAIFARDIDRIGSLAETDTLLLHGITMTGIDELILWRPDTVKVILEVKKMRQDGLPAYFSIDTGATVYVNSRPRDVKEVRSRVEALGIETVECSVGGEAKVVREALF